MLRDRYIKKKIVGGNIGGNLFDVIKNIFSATSKIVAAKLPGIAHSFALGAAKTAGEKLATNLIAPKAITREVKEVLTDITPNPEVKRVLVEKAKQLISEDNRALLSNLMAGTGCKKKHGKGLARIK